MNVRKELFAAILACALASIGLGQEINRLAGVSWQVNPASLTAQSNQNWSGAEIELHDLRAFVTLPKILKPDTSLLFARVDYQQLQSQVLNGPDVHNLPEQFHAISLRIGYSHRFRNQRVLGFLQPSLASDFSGALSGNDVLFQGAALYIQESPNEDWQLGAGIMYTTLLGEPLLLPLFRLYYGKGKMRYSAQIPSWLRIYWQPSERFTAGIRIGINGNQYRVDSNIELPDLPRFSYANFSATTAGPEIQWAIKPNWYVSGSSGYTFGRRYLLLETTPNEESNFRLSGGPFVRLGFFYGIP